jgi:hypothetical protein
MFEECQQVGVEGAVRLPFGVGYSVITGFETVLNQDTVFLGTMQVFRAGTCSLRGG